MTKIETYTDEMVLKFITGAEPLEYFDKFVATVDTPQKYMFGPFMAQ